ncbi:MAG: hypothetical protein ABMA64_08405 [Myxococcota bacterium]
MLGWMWLACKSEGEAGVHADGYAEPAVHGLAAKLGAGIDPSGDCRDCHGSDLEGEGDAVACSSCHGDGWTANCTFCHGDPEEGTGAPPQDIDDTADEADLSFPPHRAHGSDARLHAPYGCDTCHLTPSSALAAGHLFDDATPGIAEVALPFDGVYREAPRTCEVACHGDGTGAPGKAAADDKKKDCDSCHAAEPDTGEHGEHLRHGVPCAECHPDVDLSEAISDPALHVQGEVDLALPAGISFAGGQCSGSCHNEQHNSRTW